MRDPKDIVHNGKTVSEILRLHNIWLQWGGGGERANLRSANLWNADLRKANLWNADLFNASLRDADLRGADLGGANLWNANLGGADLGGANLGGADLGEADLFNASLRDADLGGAHGNMREVKNAQFDTWPITWTTAPDGIVTLQIGCQKHDLALWEKSDPRWIAAMDDNAAEWWSKYRDVVLSLVKASPATPWGKGGRQCIKPNAPNPPTPLACLDLMIETMEAKFPPPSFDEKESEYNDDVTTEVVQQINKERGVDVSNGTWRKIDG